MDKILLVDLSYLYLKYYYVAKVNYEEDGMGKVHEKHIQGLMRFFSILVQKNKEFKKIYVVADCSSDETESAKLYEGYKAGRIKDEGTFKNLQSFIAMLSCFPNIIILRNSKREADDVIAYLALTLHKRYEVLIYSGDKDMIQLTSCPNVYMSDKYEKGSFILFTDEDIFSKFKNSKKEDFTRISTDKKDILKYRVFKGDPSDNIPPAIPRLLDKDIIYLIQECWKEPFLDEDVFNLILTSCTREKVLTKLKENKESIFRNYALMCLMNKCDDDVIVKGTSHLGKSLQKDLPEIMNLLQQFKVLYYSEGMK